MFCMFLFTTSEIAFIGYCRQEWVKCKRDVRPNLLLDTSKISEIGDSLMVSEVILL
jgi:hypothetical protein